MAQTVATSSVSGRNRRPTFLWQGLLILLPVLVLAAVGFFSLRQDKTLAQREAAEKAQSIADELAQKLWAALAEQKDDQRFHYFEISARGELVHPPPRAPFALQPLNPSELSQEQGRLWSAAQQAERDERGLDGAIETYRKFIQLDPPRNFAASAHFGLALLLARQGNAQAAAEMFDLVLKKYSGATGETGLPLDLLAALKRLELQPRLKSQPGAPCREASTAITRHAFAAPNWLTGQFLQRAAEIERVAGWTNSLARGLSDWNDQEWLRQLYDAARPHFRANAVPLASTMFNPPDRDAVGDVAKQPPETTNQLLLATTSEVHRVAVPRWFWFDAPGNPRGTNDFGGSQEAFVPGPETHWFACRFDSDSPDMLRIGCRPATDVVPELARIVHDSKQVPEYFGVSLDLAGESILSSNNLPTVTLEVGGKGSGQHWVAATPKRPPAILASSGKLENDAELLRVHVHLTSPEMLYLRQNQRALLFGLLIGTSALTAVAGFFSARRAFHKQQQLTEMKSNFVSSVSHELRAPIASVRLMAEGLERGKIQEPSKRNEYFRFIVQECRRLSSLIENVLDFSRIEQGRKQYEFEPTDLAALVRQTVKLMEPAAAERNITLAVSADDAQRMGARAEEQPGVLDGPHPGPLPQEREVQAPSLDIAIAGEPAALPEACSAAMALVPQPAVDGRAIQQALVNLIDNALKHSPGGSTVTIGLKFPEPDAAPAGAVRAPANASLPPSGRPSIQLWVEDHGDGIAPEEHERIFERFYRCGSELRRETQGVGIGLSIVKHIVEAHGGRMLVRSAVGEGSRFTMELPMRNDTDFSERCPAS